MTKKPLLVIFSIILLSACTNTPTEDDKYNIKDPKNSLRNVNVETEITNIYLNENDISFDINIIRPDIQTTVTGGESLPIGLQTRLMYITTPEDTEFGYGSMCSRYMSTSHRCPDYLGEEINPAEKFYKAFIKIVFEDDTYAEQIVEIPIPETLSPPKIIFPTTTPEQNSKLKISFVDVGADNYDIEVNLCRPYGNDGINPCLDGDEYQIAREDGEIKLLTNSTAKPTKSVEDGVITIESMFPISFEESVEYYITATKNGKTDNNIPTMTTSYSSISFP